MAPTGSGGSRDGRDNPNPNISDLLQKLKLTEDEVAVLEFSDDEDQVAMVPVECALFGKVLSPVIVHVNNVRSAMNAAWGNPVGFKIWSIGEKEDNLFVVEFGSPPRSREGAVRGSMDGGKVFSIAAGI